MANRTLLIAAVFLLAPAAGAAFSYKPIYVDPALGGWADPLQSMVYRAGHGELFYVAGLFLGERGQLHVVSRSRGTLRRFDREHLGRFATKLAQAMAPAARGLSEEMALTGVVFTFYCVLLQSNVRCLQLYESCVPAEAFAEVRPIPLRIVERRTKVLPPP